MNKVPFWVKLLSKLGLMKSHKIEIEWDKEEQMFFASSKDIDGLILEAESIPEMLESLHEVIPMLLEANNSTLKQQDAHLDIHLKSGLSELLGQPT
ncbi:MAG: DUF1902 domain-containing protein [Rhodobiaceae bacterium]|jgi:predicted RNase H-like HicB family nuclease|nr:DUF1902 domain-containing protein [Rhodobiaceae bacterium]